MVVTIYKNGQEQDLEAFRIKIAIPDDKKRAMHDYVASHEQRVNECIPRLDQDGSRWYDPSYNFKEAMDRFLRYATYIENLLDQPYVPLKNTLEQMNDYTCWLSFKPDGFTCYRELNCSMYYAEKLIRLGLPIRLSNEEKERILEAEEEIYNNDDQLIIKMLSRHKNLGLPTTLDPGKKENLERMLTGSRRLLFNNWLVCAALRAGLDIPPLFSEDIEYPIRTWIKGDEAEMQKLYACRFDRLPIDFNSYCLGEYISAMHHLHRLLD